RLIVAGTDRYYAIVNGGRGGPCRIFDRSDGRLVYGDAGYVVTDGRTTWASQLAPAADVAVDTGAGVAEGTVALGEVRQTLLTPGSFVVLRVLNHTLFRSRTLANLLRRLIVKRLITDRRTGPLRLTRRFSFEADAIRFEDHITAQ